MITRNIIIKLAKEVGFDLVGVVPAGALAEERKRFEEWMLDGNHSTLQYLERNVEKRFDMTKLVENSHSVVVCAVSYLSPYGRGYRSGWRPKIASYALNADYHVTIKSMLAELAEKLKSYAPELRFRAFVDSAPVAEKSLAVRAGLGWIGRQSLVVNPKLGSMMHLGELVIDVAVDEYDSPMQGVGCGSCRRCVEACPNQAILENRTIDTRRCISCRTIEREGCAESITLDGWIFGCDACQSVCPFNEHAQLHTNPKFDPCVDPYELTTERWLQMTDEEFTAIASATPMTRSGLDRIKGNVVK
jgi:epoxyqueuosine reductase